MMSPGEEDPASTMPDDEALRTTEMTLSNTTKNTAGHDENAPAASSLTSSSSEGTTSWQVEPWQHAFYHTTTSVLGILAIVALPASFAYVGWGGGLVILLTSTVVSYLSGVLIIELQEPHMKTYSDIANATMWPGFANIFIRPFQVLLFFQVTVLNSLTLGQTFHGLALSSGTTTLSQSAWIAVAGAITILPAMIPTLSQMWQLSLVGALTAIAGTIVLVIACGVAIGSGSRQEASFGRPPPYGDDDPTVDFAMGVLISFGILAFAYGGHSVLPDVQASLHCKDLEASHHSMKKGLTAAYFFIFPCYLAITTIGYAAFGAEVSGFLIDSISPFVSQAFLIIMDIFLIVNTLALSMVYMQAFFTLIEDICPWFGHHFNGRLTLRQVLMRMTVVALCTLFAAAIPFFGALSAFTGAICFTPLTVRARMVVVRENESERRAGGLSPSSCYSFAVHLSICLLEPFQAGRESKHLEDSLLLVLCCTIHNLGDMWCHWLQ